MDVPADMPGKGVDKARGRLWMRQDPNIYERFIRSIRTGKNDQPDFTRGAAVQKILDACFESDRKGVAVDL